MSSNDSAAPSKKRAKTAKSEPVTERDPTPRQELPKGQQGLKIVSWNVDGIRAGGRLEDLRALVQAEDPDLLCLQETKLQGPWAEDWRSVLEGYDAYWSCSVGKKGYAGTAVFIRSPKTSATPPPTVSGAVEGGTFVTPGTGAPAAKPAGGIESFFKAKGPEIASAVIKQSP